MLHYFCCVLNNLFHIIGMDGWNWASVWNLRVQKYRDFWWNILFYAGSIFLLECCYLCLLGRHYGNYVSIHNNIPWIYQPDIEIKVRLESRNNILAMWNWQKFYKGVVWGGPFLGGGGRFMASKPPLKPPPKNQPLKPPLRGRFVVIDSEIW